MYKGQVTQNTGIDWKKVKLTLSSGNPTQNNNAPILQAWFLRFGYNRGFVQYDNSNAKMKGVKKKSNTVVMRSM